MMIQITNPENSAFADFSSTAIKIKDGEGGKIMPLSEAAFDATCFAGYYEVYGTS